MCYGCLKGAYSVSLLRNKHTDTWYFGGLFSSDIEGGGSAKNHGHKSALYSAAAEKQENTGL